MKKIVFLFATLFFAQFLHAQITRDDYRSIIPLLQSEDLKKAYNLSTKLLHEQPNDSSEYRSMVVYCRIYAAVSMVANGKMKCEKLVATLAEHKGEAIFLAGHLASTDGRNTLNKTFLSFAGDKANGLTTVTNSKLKIMLLEEITFAQAVNPENYVGYTVRCGGKLTDISLYHDDATKNCILKITVSDAFIRRTK